MSPGKAEEPAGASSKPRELLLVGEREERVDVMLDVRRTKQRIAAIAAVFFAAAAALSLASCGGGARPAQSAEEGPKYPPGTSEDMLTQTTGSGGLAREKGTETEEGGRKEAAAPPRASAELAGARFTVVEATRQDSNADALPSGRREVPGDYYEIELEVENTGEDIVDLAQYSFRLSSPGIDAGQYEEYYGADGTFGRYVSENVISGVLLDYATLQPAYYLLKIGEILEGVFLFFDLNPKSASRNERVDKESTKLVIRKVRGEGSGGEVEISLSGYPD